MVAQTVRGSVLRSDGTPAAYVVVTATVEGARSDEAAARALTDARGGYRLRVPAPNARYRLRALQVGWRPTNGPVVGPFANDSVTEDVASFAMEGAAISLPTVTVRTTDVCGERGRDGATVAAAWEQARTALLASGLRADTSRGDATLRTDWVEYARQLDNSGKRVVQQSRRLASGMTARAFSSIAADSLAAHGYVVDAADGTVFHAPDAEVLLSGSFAALHCFNLEPATAEQPSWIGVAFRPARAIGGRADVRGTLWLEQGTGELRQLQYRYTNLPAAAEAAEPGGEVAFLHLATGEWLVREWTIRMPLVNARAASVNVGQRNLVVKPTSRTLTGVQIVGGSVLRVSRTGTALFEGDGATLEVRARGADVDHPVTAIRASLEGTDYAWTSDATGAARLHPVWPGSYDLRVSSALMDSLGVRTPALPITIGEDGRVVDVRLPSSSDVVRAVCVDAPSNTSLLRGVVRDSRGRAVPNATLRVRVARERETVAGEARVILNDDARRVQADTNGHWQLCGVPRETPLAVYAAAPAGTRDTLYSVTSALAALDVALTRQDIAQLSLRVVDEQLRPLRDVVVDVTALSGDSIALRTDAAGRTSARDLPRGSATVRLRRVGYQEGTIVIELASGLNDIPVVLDPLSAPSLDTVRVSAARARNTRFSDFDKRRAAGIPTASIDEEEIERRAPASTFQLFARLPGVMLLDSLGSWYAKSRREQTVTCFIRVAVDGRVLPDSRPNLALLPSPKEVRGIEFFAGPARIPPELYSFGALDNGRSFCGLIAIWTK